MKANEAPDKLYLSDFTDTTEPVFYIKQDNTKKTDIEYIRKDAFIEKACSWMENNLQGIVGGSIYIEDFRKYMEK